MRHLHKVSVLALVSGMAWSNMAFAQASPDADDAVGLADIVVTARKVEENVQDVPISIISVSGATLQRQNIVQMQDLARIAPGLTLKASNSTPTGINLQMRGQSVADVVATTDPAVGTYVDGFYWARAYGLNADLVDVQSASVLRGPQGTLFGRNTTGGALSIQTNNPDLTEISGLISGTYGRFNERSATGVLNLPIVKDKIALRVAGNFLKRDGYLNSVPFTFNGAAVPNAFLTAIPLSGANSPRGSVGRKLGGRSNYTVRAKLLVQATDNLDFLFSAEQFRYSAFGQQVKLAAVDSVGGSTASLEAGISLGGSIATPGPTIGLGQSFFNAYTATTGGDTVSTNEDSFYFTKTQTYTGTATLDTVFGSMKFISGYRHIDANNNFDVDGSPIQLISSNSAQDLSSYSGELQIVGKAFSDKLDFAIGALYFKEYGIDSSRSTNVNAVTNASGLPFANQTVGISNAKIDNQSMGVYGQGTYHFSDKFSFVGGLRYSVDDKGVSLFQRNVNILTNVPVSCIIAGTVLTSTPQPCRIDRKNDFSALSYTAGFNYQPNEDLLLYAKTSKGFRSGGQQARFSKPDPAELLAFRPEISFEHEIGFKGEFLDRRLRVNLAAFYNNSKDLQRTALVAFLRGGRPATTTVVSNAAKARTYGAEFDATAVLFDGFTLTFNAAHINAKYKEYSIPVLDLTTAAPLDTVLSDRSNDPFDQVPKWAFTLGGNYDRTFGWGKLNLNAAYAWQGSTSIAGAAFRFDTANNRAILTADGTFWSIAGAQRVLDLTQQKAGGQLNLRAGVTLMDDSLELAVWGRNVNSFRPNVSALVFAPPFGATVVQRRDPSSYGATATFRF